MASITKIATTGGKSHPANCGKGRQNPVIACDKLRQIRCRLLSPIAAHYNGTFFGVTNRKGMVSSKNQGFQVSESRQKFHSTERIKLIADWRSERPFLKLERT